MHGRRCLFSIIRDITERKRFELEREELLAATQRAPSAPDVPTLAEGGIKGAESGTWYVMLAPRGTPQAIIDVLNREINAALATQSLRDQLATVGVVPETGTPETKPPDDSGEKKD